MIDLPGYTLTPLPQQLRSLPKRAGRFNQELASTAPPLAPVLIASGLGNACEVKPFFQSLFSGDLLRPLQFANSVGSAATFYLLSHQGESHEAAMICQGELSFAMALWQAQSLLLNEPRYDHIILGTIDLVFDDAEMMRKRYGIEAELEISEGVHWFRVQREPNGWMMKRFIFTRSKVEVENFYASLETSICTLLPRQPKTPFPGPYLVAPSYYPTVGAAQFAEFAGQEAHRQVLLYSSDHTGLTAIVHCVKHDQAL